jgi:hypothetical protein
MKKEYMQPTVTLVKVQTAQLIASSPGYSTTIFTEETSGNLSREIGLPWGDE